MDKSELKALREFLGLTKTAMAKQLGIGYRMYHYVENGNKSLSKASEMLAENLLKSTKGSDF